MVLNSNNKDNSAIAFFDSGMGGLTVLHEAIRHLPQENYIYFADRDNIPYGSKSAERINGLVNKAAAFLNKFNPKALVLACNTATSVVVSELRLKYNFPIIGMEPAVKPAAMLPGNKKILITATERTLEEEKLNVLISGLDAQDRVEKRALPKLVQMAETMDFNSIEVRDYLENEFSDYSWSDYSAIVLGCTHFIYFKDQIQKSIPPHITIIDGNKGTVRRLKSLIKKSNQNKKGSIEFYTSFKRCDVSIFQGYLHYLDTYQKDE